jgi:hypothetical protein
MIRRFKSTLVANGDSDIFTVDSTDTNDAVVNVGFSIAGTWNSSTVSLKICPNTTESPQVYTAVTSAAYTSDTADSWDIPAGCNFKLTVSGAGSPIPALVYRIVGHIRQA